MVLQAAGGLPLASQRGVGVASFERARIEVESLQAAQRQQQRRQQRRQDVAGETSEAGPASRHPQQDPSPGQQQGAAGDAGSDAEAASGGEPMDVDGPTNPQPAAAAAAAAGARGRQQGGAAAPANPASQRPVPPLPVVNTRGAQNIVGGKPDLLQVRLVGEKVACAGGVAGQLASPPGWHPEPTFP